MTSDQRGPRVVCIIPARGGSKRLPGKNLIDIGGSPLVVHSIRHALAARTVSEVYVSTDHPAIAAVSRRAGARVIRRPASISGDRASSESALLHALDRIQALGGPPPDLVVFLQCTSPVRRPEDIDHAVRQLVRERADSLFSACENNRLIWCRRVWKLRSLNYDYRNRKREQEFPEQFRENGSIYVFKPSVLLRNKNRLGGKISVYRMDYWSSFQIDTPEHAELCSWILKSRNAADRLPAGIDLVVFDFDGVFTDNRVRVTAGGNETVVCDRADGLGIARLRKLRVPMIVLSTEKHPVVSARAAKLKLACVQGVADKESFLRRYARKKRIDLGRAVYVGNDVNDLGCMTAVGAPVAVADAHPDVIRAASIVLTRPGGRGAVREICDLIARSVRP